MIIAQEGVFSTELWLVMLVSWLVLELDFLGGVIGGGVGILEGGREKKELRVSLPLPKLLPPPRELLLLLSSTLETYIFLLRLSKLSIFCITVIFEGVKFGDEADFFGVEQNVGAPITPFWSEEGSGPMTL